MNLQQLQQPWHGKKQDPNKGNKGKNPVKTPPKKKTSREPTPSLTPSSELGPKLRHRAGPPKVNEESGYGRTRNGTKETRPRKITIYLKIQHKLSQRQV